MVSAPRKTAPPSANPVALTTQDLNELFIRDKAPSDDNTETAEPTANAVLMQPELLYNGILFEIAIAEQIAKELLAIVRPRDEAMVTAPEAKHQPVQ